MEYIADGINKKVVYRSKNKRGMMMSEMRKITKKYYLRQIVACWLVSCLLFNTTVVLALEQGNLTGASGLMGATWGDDAVLNTANNAILDWSNFDTTATQSVTFNQYLNGVLSSDSAVLNRIASGEVPTYFNGALYANGRVFIINPAGVLFGATARINVTQLVASSLNITNQNFLDGKYDFSGGSGSVINQGTIVADSMVALIGKKVLNTGTINAPGGLVVMTAGDRVLLGKPGSDVVVEVVSVSASDITAAADAMADGDVINEGTVEAAGGEIILAAGDTFSRAVEGLEGLSVAVESGTGTVGQYGTLSADEGGKITLTAADEVILGEDSLTTVNGGSEGDGGTIIAYSPGLATFSEGALIEARGGETAGDGGFVEVSGLEGYLLAGTADLRAPAGEAGTLLLDPHHNVFISDNPSDYYNINNTWLEYQLGMGNMWISTNGGGIGDGDITVLDLVVWASIYGLTLDAARDIYVAADIINTGTGRIQLEADRHIFADAPLSTRGNLRLLADKNGNVVGNMYSGDGVALFGGHDVEIRGNDIILGGPVLAGRDLTIFGRDCGPGDGPYEWGNIWAKDTLTAGRDISISVTGVKKVCTGWHWEGHGCHRHKVYDYEYVYYPGTITLDGDVTACRDIKIYNDTYTRNVTGYGVTLNAGHNIELKNSCNPYENCTFIQGTNYLGLIAGDTIKAWNTVISVLGSTLLMQQGPSINTADYMFANQGNTNLTLISDNGSVTSTTGDNAANKWKSIGAHANQNITLAQDGSSDKAGNSNFKNTIHLGYSGTPGRSLWAENGDIDIDGFSIKPADGFGGLSVEAGGYVDMYVVHEIRLGGDVISGDYMSLFADHDERFGSHVWVEGHVNSGGTTNIEGMNVFLDGGATSEGDMTITAHGLYGIANAPDEHLQYSGDVRAGGKLESKSGKIDITAIRATGFDDELISSSYNYLDPTEEPYLNMDIIPDYVDTYKGSILVQDVEAATSVDMTAGYDIEADNVTAGTTFDAEAGRHITLDSAISGGNMTLAADKDTTDIYSGDVTAGPLTSLGGDVEISASDSTIFLNGNVTAGDDVILHNNTEAADGVKIEAGDDIHIGGDDAAFASSEHPPGVYEYKSLTGLGDLTLKSASNGDGYGNIMIGGMVQTCGDLTMIAGGGTDPAGIIGWEQSNIKIVGPVITQASGNMYAKAGDDIQLYGLKPDGTPHPAGGALSSGNMTLIAYDDVQTFNNAGLTTIDPAKGDMYISAGDDDAIIGPEPGEKEVVVTGDVDSAGKLTVEAQDDIELKRNVKSADDMSMQAGDDIELNEWSGNTESGGMMKLIAGVSNPGGDVEGWGQLTTTNPANGDMTVKAADDIYLDNTPISAQSAGTMTMAADSDDNYDGDLTAQGDLIGNMYLSGYDVTVYGDVTSYGTLDVIAVDDIMLKRNVSSYYDMTMNAGDNIRLNEYSGNTESTYGTMTLNAGLAYGSTPYPDFDCDWMNGSIKIGGHAYSYGNMTMNAKGGGIVFFDGWFNDVMSGSIYIQDYAKSQYGLMNMTAIGGDEFATCDLAEVVCMNGSIKIGDYAYSRNNMSLSATGGSEGFDFYDCFDLDGMNGSIKIGNYAYSEYGNIGMTANGGCEFMTNDYVDADLMDGSIKIGGNGTGNVTSYYNINLSAHGGGEAMTKDEIDVDGMNGSILVCGNADARYGSLNMSAVGGSEALTCDKFDIDGMNGSILIGGSVESLYNMDLLAVGGSEFLTCDQIDIDGMNGSILINNGARSEYGTLKMTAIGGSDFGTCDLVDFDAMNGSIKINNYVQSMYGMELKAIGGSEFCSFDIFDTDLMNGSIFINGNASTSYGDMKLTAIGGSDFHTLDAVDTDCMNGSIKVLGSLDVYGGDMLLTAIGGSEFCSLDCVDIDGMNGSILIQGRVTALGDEECETSGGNITMTAMGGSNFGSSEKVDIDGMNGSIQICGGVHSDADMKLTAIGGSEFGTTSCFDLSGMNGSIKFGGYANSGGNMELTAIGGSEFRTLDFVDSECMNGSIKFGGYAHSGGDMKMTAIGGSEFLTADKVDTAGMNGSIKACGYLESEGDMSLTAIGGSEFCTIDCFDSELMNGSIKIFGYARSYGDMTMTAVGGSDFHTFDGFDGDFMNGTIWLGSAKSDGDMTLRAVGGGEYGSHDFYDLTFFSGDVVALGDLESTGGSVKIYSDDDTTYLGGDVTAYVDVLLNNNTKFIGFGDQRVTAETGMITANGWLDKIPIWTCWGPTYGSLYLDAYGDISLAGDVIAAMCCPEMCWSVGGGVSIISDNGRIYTPGKYVMDKDGIYQPALAIDITGRSNQFGWFGPVGVDLPYGPGKAAIVIRSKDDLMLHPWSDLLACGTYYAEGVDDRVGVGFLAVPDTIGGYLRNEGDAFDAAIYVGSTAGDVHLGGEVDIRSLEWVPYDGLDHSYDLETTSVCRCGYWDCVSRGTMIADAWDTITFGDKFESALADGRVGDRLEVCSRITEWLEDAVGRLPYVYGGGLFPPGYTYVLRGAGLENPGITDGRAWVLESKGTIPPAPLNAMQLEGLEQQVPGVEGCPAVMAAAADELGIEDDEIEVTVANAMAAAGDIQPCETCARLVNAAAILRDEDGSRMAALAEVINTVAPADVPFTPEVGTLIAAAFEGRASDGTAYATALEYVDAFVEYVRVLDTEMGSPVGDSVEFVMEKHGAGINASPNDNVAAYVAARLEAIGG